MSADKTVIVAGASGVFGRHITRTLQDAGYQVLGLGRSATNEISADLLDRDGLLRAVQGVRADVVVHAATALRKVPLSHKDMYRTDDLRTTGTRNLVEAARVVGARRFIGENIVFGYGFRDFGERVLTEADPFVGTDPDRGFARHLAAMRDKERIPLESGLEAISLRYGLFYGAASPPSSRRHGRVLPWVNLADAASAVLAAIEHGRPGAAYNIADESQLGSGGMVKALAAAYRTPKPLTVPTWLTVVAPFMHRVATISLRVSTEKARRELGWQPAFRTVAAGLQALTSRDSVQR